MKYTIHGYSQEKSIEKTIFQAKKELDFLNI